MTKYVARWVLPITSAPIPDGAVCVANGRIEWVGRAADAPPGELVDLGESILLPGLVNVHTHLELTAMRGWLEDLSFRHWILRLTKGRQAVLDRSRLLASARVGIAEGLLAGITTYADTTESGVVHQAMREMGVRGIAYQEVFGPSESQHDEALRELRARVEALAAEDGALVSTGVSPHAPYTVSDALFAATSRLARDASLPMAIHIAESDAEFRLVRDAEGEFADALRARGIEVVPRAATPIRLLADAGALEARPLLIHCVRVDHDDRALIAAADCAVAHCPSSNAKLGHGIAPLLEMIEAGIRVGLGSDSVASNNRMDLLDEARTAILMQRVVHGRPDALGATAALRLATIDAARALGIDAEVGSLEVGKSADLAAFGVEEPRTLPVFDPAAALVYAGPGRPARFVMVAGRVLVSDGRLDPDVAADVRVLRESATALSGHVPTS